MAPRREGFIEFHHKQFETKFRKSYCQFCQINNEMKVSNFDFWMLAGMFSLVGGLGIWEGTELHPVFYSQSGIIFGSIGYLAHKVFYLDRRKESTAISH